MARFQSVTLVKGDKQRVAHTQAALTQAEWDGFAVQESDTEAAAKLEKATTKAARTGAAAPTAAH